MDLVVGEATPDYLFHPHVPGRVRRAIPAAKLIVVLRDPVDRAFSHYWHQVERGHERLSFDEAIRSEDERLAGELERMLQDDTYLSFARHHYSYATRGRYAEQLKWWLALFPRDKGNRDTETLVSKIAGHTWEALDYADGLVRFGVQSAVARPEAAALIRKLMTERGMTVPPANRNVDSICIVEICKERSWN